MENIAENLRNNEVFPPLFFNLKEKFEKGEPLELNSHVRKEILKWVYSFLFDRDALWNNKGNEEFSLNEGMVLVNKLAHHAKVNRHDRDHVEQVLANAVFFSWVDFLTESQEEEKNNDIKFITDSLKHSIAALLHDIGYIGCLPRESAEFRHFLKNSTKETYNNHPHISSAQSKRILDWVFEEGYERIRLFLHPKLLMYAERYIPILLKNKKVVEKWKSEIVKAINEHGTAQIVASKKNEGRPALSKNIILADKIHIENRLNVSLKNPSNELVQQNVFPLNKAGKKDCAPTKSDIINAAHTRMAISVKGTKLIIDLVKKKIELVLQPELKNVTKIAEKYKLHQPFTYDELAFKNDFQDAYGAFAKKLKYILENWDIDFSSGIEEEVK
jgi:hypothetical protein